MTTEALKIKKPVPAWKVRLVGFAAGAGTFLAASASAIDFTAVTAVIDDVVLIFPSMVAVVISAIPIIIIIAIAAFILGLLDSILKGIKM